MLRSKQIWECLQNNLQRGKWYTLDDIYEIVENFCELDDEDIIPQDSRSTTPKWKRNVRNVLQSKKKYINQLEWNSRNSTYKI
jgi:hypothetical protein